MVDINDGFVATYKAGKDYDSPWLVVHAPDAATFKERLDAVTAGLLNQLAETSLLFQATYAAHKGGLKPQVAQDTSTPLEPVPVPQPQAAPAPAPAPQPAKQYHPEGKRCSSCGEAMYYQEWTAKSGKLTKAYKCDGKGMGHDIEFAGGKR